MWLLSPTPARPAGYFHHNHASWNNAAEVPEESCLSQVCLWLRLNAPWCGWKNKNKNTELLMTYPDLSKMCLKGRDFTHSLSWTMFLSSPPWPWPDVRDPLATTGGSSPWQRTHSRQNRSRSSWIHTAVHTPLPILYIDTHTQKDTQREWMSKFKLSCMFHLLHLHFLYSCK